MLRRNPFSLSSGSECEILLRARARCRYGRASGRLAERGRRQAAALHWRRRQPRQGNASPHFLSPTHLASTHLLYTSSPLPHLTSSAHQGERSIPREDVAEVLVQALLIPAYKGRSFDIRSMNEGEGEVTSVVLSSLAHSRLLTPSLAFSRLLR